ISTSRTMSTETTQGSTPSTRTSGTGTRFWAATDATWATRARTKRARVCACAGGRTVPRSATRARAPAERGMKLGRSNRGRRNSMKHTLLLSGVIAVLAIGAPAYSQYIYMDRNGDGVCTSADVLSSSSTSVDTWLNTNHNANGPTVTSCTPSQPMDIFSYDMLVHSSGAGCVTSICLSNS